MKQRVFSCVAVRETLPLQFKPDSRHTLVHRAIVPRCIYAGRVKLRI